MRRVRSASFFVLALTSGLAACDESPAIEGRDDDVRVDAGGAAREPDAGSAPACDDDACEGDAVCVEGACRAPSDAQIAQRAELDEALAWLRGRTAWHAPLDWEALGLAARRELYRGDGSAAAYYGPLFHAFVKVPQGHQGLYLAQGCGSSTPLTSFTSRGVCGRPHPRGAIVTGAREGNPLGLRPGDVVVGAGALRGQAWLAALADRPACVTSRPSAAYTEASVAAAFDELSRPGEELEVEAPDGSTRRVTVPPKVAGDVIESCQEPFRRDTSQAAVATLRPDGVAVIRVPSFVDPDVPFPADDDPAAFETYRRNFETKIAAVFETVKTARAIVWDVRGNGGGLTVIGLAIASGFPGARADLLSECEARVVDSEPPRFRGPRYARYALTPGGPFAYAGKVAVLTDGLNYSAADYFPLAVKERTNALVVGAATAGGYGATSTSKRFDGPPAYTLSADLNRCVDAAGAPLEGRSVVPHVRVDYEPADLAAGRDTVLERAIRELETR